ncbi:MAG: OB-fold domain-containing protein [Pseudomonadota bacterium]
MAYGIISFGGYVPPIRLARSAIFEAVGWCSPGLKGLAAGHRSVGNWDEDSLTMAVEAGRDCLGGLATDVQQVALASTTLPFADRSNSGVVADALQLTEFAGTEDVGGSRRAATSVLSRLARGQGGNTLLIGSDCRDAKPGSTQEMSYGHGAAALLVGEGDPCAVFLGAASVHDDLVDQYRSADDDFDYALEERWARDEGYSKIVPRAVAAALERANLAASDIDHIVLHGSTGAARAVAKATGLDAKKFADSLAGSVGDCGVAQAMMMLTNVLASAGVGEKILVIGFGQGADAVIIETQGAISQVQKGRGLAKYLEQTRETDKYTFFLSIRQQIEMDYGIRGERDNRTALSTAFRKRYDITAMMGGRCTKCNTLQFPRSILCVNCGAKNTQEPESLSAEIGRVKSFTEDWLAFAPCPPYIYGNVEFKDGANIMLEFTDFDAGQVQVGDEIRLVFRVKDYDNRRNYRRYFWKPAPLLGDAA